MGCKRLKIFLVFISAFFVGLPSAFAFTLHMPHLTGDNAAWDDILQIDNDSTDDASFEITLYDGSGNIIYQTTHNISALNESVLFLKDFVDSAQTGVITYDNEMLKFRLTYQNINGGVAEFRLDDTLSSNIGLYFSDSEVLPLIENKGAAIANMSDTVAEVTLYAIGGGSIIDSFSTTIAPKCKIAGVIGSDWFSSKSDIKKIIAKEQSNSDSLKGLVICSNEDNSKLLFTPSTTVSGFMACTDADDDGYFAEAGCGTEIDCNDSDAAVNPDAQEICGDGIDQDCDGEDLKCPGDVDDDKDGYTENQGDCDDEDASIHPGATEFCGDGIDQDCDGEDLKCPGDVDDDKDGYTENQGDCDDEDASIHPGATEICGDGIDQDCNGGDEQCGPSQECEVTCEMGDGTASWGLSCETGTATGSQNCLRSYTYYPGTSILKCYSQNCWGTKTYSNTGNTYDFDFEVDWCNDKIEVTVDGVGTCSDFY